MRAALRRVRKQLGRGALPPEAEALPPEALPPEALPRAAEGRSAKLSPCIAYPPHSKLPHGFRILSSCAPLCAPLSSRRAEMRV